MHFSSELFKINSALGKARRTSAKRRSRNVVFDERRNCWGSIRERLGLSVDEISRMLNIDCITWRNCENSIHVPSAVIAKRLQSILRPHGLDIALEDLYQHIIVENSLTMLPPGWPLFVPTRDFINPNAYYRNLDDLNDEQERNDV